MELHFYELIFSPRFLFQPMLMTVKNAVLCIFFINALDIVFNLMRDVFPHLVAANGFQ